MQKNHEGWDFSRCAAVLGKETALLKRAGLVQEEARRALSAREWTAFNKLQGELERLSGEFAGLEAGRAELFAALGADGEASFYALCAALPEGERLELGRLYRELRLETARVKAGAEIFAQYLAELKLITAAFIGAAFPARKAAFYSRKGALAPQDLRSMVLNRHV